MLRPKVFSKIDKKIVEVVEIDFNYKLLVVRNIDNSGNNTVVTLSFSKAEFMENTGFKDKNGKYIYMGDIVKDDVQIYTIKRSEVYKIISMSNKKTCVLLDKYICREIEAIGNIYENKELLENI